MPGYHISPKTGRPNKCTASARACPVGGDHYDSQEAATKGQEAKLAAAHEPVKTFKKQESKDVALLQRLTPKDEEYAERWGQTYAKEGGATVQRVQENTRKTIAAMRQLQSEMPGSFQVLNGGAYYRFKAHASQWTLEVQNGKDGTTHVRTFNPGVPVYGDHSRDGSWTFPARSTVESHSQTIGKLYKDFISADANQSAEPMWG